MTKIDNLKCWIKYKLLHIARKRKDIREFWQRAENDNWKKYSEGKEKSIFLVSLIKMLSLHKGARILELGCNVGRNLSYLQSIGYINLFGVELNKKAVAVSEKLYLNLVKAKIANDTIEHYILYNTEHYDLIFTMAVLEHIPKESEWIFKYMVRHGDYIITIEDEKSINKICFPRNYKKIFESLGMRQIYETDCINVHPTLTKNFRARMFRG